MTVKFCRSMAATALAGLIALAPVAPVHGQTPDTAAPQNQNQAPVAAQNQPAIPVAIPKGRDYTIPHSWFPHVFAPYLPIHLDPPQYVNSPRIEQLIKNGKLPLSVAQAVELALENNPDITVQRYNSWLAETDILRAKGGGAQRGVSVVTTPLAFADVPQLSFDPSLTSSGIIDRRSTPVNNPLTAGTGTTNSTTSSTTIAPIAAPLSTLTDTVDLQYSQAFHTGTQFSLAFNNVRTSSTSAAVLFNPAVQSTGTATIIQPLLNGFGRLVNERYIKIAVITKKVVDYAFQQSLITDITAVEDDYWELVYARGNVDVQVRAVQLAQALYDDNKRQVDVGTLAPIEIVRAEAQLATAQQALIAAQTAQLQEQSLLMSVIALDPNAPGLRNVEIIPTDTVQTPPPIENVPLSDAVAEALAKRPDVLELKTNLDADNINVKISKNGLLPTLNLSGFATGVGLGGDAKVTTSTTTGASNEEIVAAGGAPVLLENGNGVAVPVYVPSAIPGNTAHYAGGLGTAQSELFRGVFPEYEAQLSLTLPIRNRVAQADNARALITERQDQAKLQQSANGVVVDVQNAQILLQQDRPAVVAAQKTRALQEETLDAEQKKLALGASTIFLVVTDQQALSAAAAAEVRAEVNLVEARVNYERALGRTLDVNQITLANAKTGVAPHDTLIPGTLADGGLVGEKEALQTLPNSPK